jgi:hypothetical protein
MYRPTGNNGKAVAGLVCGIVGLVVFGFILGVIAIVLGMLARGEIDRTGQGGRSMATWAIVLGVIDIIAGIALFVAVLN